MFKLILVPTDGSPLSQKAVKAAVSVAKANRGKLTVVHVMPDYAAYVRERYNVPGILAAPLKQKFEKDAATVAKQHLYRACKLAKAAGVRCSGVAVVSDTVLAAILFLAELQAWFESRDRAHPEAFERFCRDYELDPDAVPRVLRRALRRKETLGRIDTPET